MAIFYLYSMTRAFIPLVLLLLNCTPQVGTPVGGYVGFLKFPNITYHIYLNWNTSVPSVQNVTFKADEFSLDTIYYRHDSLHFRLKEFYSEYNGIYNRKANRVTGQWIGEDSTVYPLEFIPVLSDTVSGLHPRTSRYEYKQPLSSEDGIAVCSLRDQLWGAPLIDSLVQSIVRGKYSDIHSLLVSRNNCLVVEEYFYRYHQNFVYNIQSATKSVVSALTGIAIEKGEIESLSETLCASLPGYETLACNSQNKDITLSDLLTMSTGINWDEQTYDYMDVRNSLSIAASNKDQFVHLLSLPRTKLDKPVFAYNSLNHILMNSILRNATHLENKVELQERLLTPLGIEKSYVSDTTPMGAIGDIGLRPRDMLKFGLLFLNDGVWKGNQIVPRAWVRASTSAKIYPRPALGYGYFWWTKDFRWQGKVVSSFFAWGYGGQYIFVVPKLKLVVVMSGSHWGTDPEDQGIKIMDEILTAIQ